jgi:DNA-binding HxlR family transcriptional regulator
MTRTHKKVGDSPTSKGAASSAAERVRNALAPVEGRWKLEIMFQLFGGKVRRFSELERALAGVSQKMLTQQLRQMEAEGLVRRVVHAEVPPRVDYALTERGQSLCPALDALLKWAEA